MESEKTTKLVVRLIFCHIIIVLQMLFIDHESFTSRVMLFFFLEFSPKMFSLTMNGLVLGKLVICLVFHDLLFKSFRFS